MFSFRKLVEPVKTLVRLKNDYQQPIKRDVKFCSTKFLSKQFDH